MIRETTFTKGYNDKMKAELLTEGYCADALNVFLDDQTIKKRTGYTEQGTDVAISKAILSQEGIEFSDGTKFILRARDNAGSTQSIVEAWTGSGAWSGVTGAAAQTAAKDHVFPVANDAVYMINDTDTVLKSTNGTSTSTIAAFPNGVDAKWFHNYMFVIDKTGRLYWSSLNDPDTWDAADYIDINPKDGELAVGLAVLKDELIIFKKSRIWALTGFGASDFTVADMGERLTGLGAQSRRSIIETVNDVYFLSYVGGIPHFRSIQRTRYGQVIANEEIISDAIEGTMGRLVASQIGNTAGIFDGRKIWWAVTTSGTYNNEVLVYDEVTKGWTRHTGINASCWSMSTLPGYPSIYFGEASATAKSYLMDSATSDNGTAISMRFDTRMYSPFPESKCKWKYMYLTADVGSAAAIDVDYSKDGYTFDDLATVTVTGSSALFPITLDSDKLGSTTVYHQRLDSAGGTAYKMQYRFGNDSATDSIVIREYQLGYKVRGLRSVSG